MKCKTNLLLVMLMGLFMSCDVELTPPESNTPVASPGINQPIRPIKNLTDSEITIASRICQNLKAQRLFLGSQPNGFQRNFSVQDKSCSTGRSSNSLIVATLNLSGANYLWTPARNVNFQPVILTERAIELDQFCEDVLNNPVVENTVLVTNRYVRFEFQAFTLVDRISLYAHELIQSQWRVTKIDEYEIDKSIQPNLRGQTTASRHQFICRPSNTLGELIQRLR